MLPPEIALLIGQLSRLRGIFRNPPRGSEIAFAVFRHPKRPYDLMDATDIDAALIRVHQRAGYPASYLPPAFPADKYCLALTGSYASPFHSPIAQQPLPAPLGLPASALRAYTYMGAYLVHLSEKAILGNESGSLLDSSYAVSSVLTERHKHQLLIHPTLSTWVG